MKGPFEKRVLEGIINPLFIILWKSLDITPIVFSERGLWKSSSLFKSSSSSGIYKSIEISLSDFIWYIING